MPVPTGLSGSVTGDSEHEVLLVDSVSSSAAQARRAVEEHLVRTSASWIDLPGVLLVVSELVTNAHQHAFGRWQLRVQAGSHRVRVEVTDGNPLPPLRRAGKLDGSGGWGLRIAEQCADTLEVVTAAGGKTMRAQWMHPDRETLALAAAQTQN